MKCGNACDLRESPKQAPDLPGKKGCPQCVEMNNFRAKPGQSFKHPPLISPTDLERRTQYLQNPEATQDNGLEWSVIARNAARRQHGHHMPVCSERICQIQNVALNPPGSRQIVWANEQNPHAAGDAIQRMIKLPTWQDARGARPQPQGPSNPGQRSSPSWSHLRRLHHPAPERSQCPPPESALRYEPDRL